mgnify:CR=1 FL=1
MSEIPTQAELQALKEKRDLEKQIAEFKERGEKASKKTLTQETELLNVERKKGETIGEYGKRIRENLDSYIEESRLKVDAALMEQDALDAGHELYMLNEKKKELSDKALAAAAVIKNLKNVFLYVVDKNILFLWLHF